MLHVLSRRLDAGQVDSPGPASMFEAQKHDNDHRKKILESIIGGRSEFSAALDLLPLA
jgi:hypothetical protein